MKKLKVQVTLLEEMLGTSSSNPEIHREFIASKAPDAPSTEEEVAALGADAVADKTMTVFPRENGRPFMWDYQIKGFFKDACGALSRVPDSKSTKLRAYKKVIDGTVFVFPRKISLNADAVGSCQRPLRADTAQGPRVALANSETIPAGTVFQFDIHILDEKSEPVIREWLDYGMLRGLGQWRNSGKGRFSWEEVK